MRRVANSIATSRLAAQPVRQAITQSVALAIACLVSYELTSQLPTRVHFVSGANDVLGGMWTTIATIFVYRFSYDKSVAAAVSRMAATLVSFILCLTYLLILPFSVWGYFDLENCELLDGFGGYHRRFVTMRQQTNEEAAANKAF